MHDRRREHALNQDAPVRLSDAAVLRFAASKPVRPVAELLNTAAEIAASTDEELVARWKWPLATCVRLRALVTDLAAELRRDPPGRAA